MIKAIVTSDNHLGSYYARLRPERLEQRRSAMQGAFERVVDAALEQRVDVFLHAGDLFDRPDPRNAERAFVARQIARLRAAGIEVIAIAGNHDSPRSLGTDGGTPPHEEWQALGAVHLMRSTRHLACRELSVRGVPIRVWGLSSDWNLPRRACPIEPCFVNASPLWDVPASNGGAGDAVAAREGVDVVLLHYAVEGWADADWEEPILSLSSLDRLRADVICVGHLHKRNERRLPGGTLLLNPGATEHRHFGEESLECGCWLLHLATGDTRAEYLPLSTQPMRTLSLDLNGEGLNGEAQTEDEKGSEADAGDASDAAAPPAKTSDVNPDSPSTLMCGVLARVKDASDSAQFLRVRLHGNVSRIRFQALDLPLLQEQGNALNFHCQLHTDDLRVCDEDAVLTIGFGVSFDAGEELQNTARALAAEYTRAGQVENEEVCHLAAGRLAAAYDRLTNRVGTTV